MLCEISEGSSRNFDWLSLLKSNSLVVFTCLFFLSVEYSVFKNIYVQNISPEIL